MSEIKRTFDVVLECKVGDKTKNNNIDSVDVEIIFMSSYVDTYIIHFYDKEHKSTQLWNRLCTQQIMQRVTSRSRSRHNWNLTKLSLRVINAKHNNNINDNNNNNNNNNNTRIYTRWFTLWHEGCIYLKTFFSLHLIIFLCTF